MYGRAVCGYAALLQGHVAEREPIYSTQYSCEEVPADWLAAWEAAAEPALHLPSHNPFIPTDFDLLQVRQPITGVINRCCQALS